jgi:hypothetical protein
MLRIILALLMAAQGGTFQIIANTPAPASGGSAPSVIQSKACHGNTGSSLTCTFGSSVTAGHNISVGVSINISSSTLSLSDNQSNTFFIHGGYPDGTNGTGEMAKVTSVASSGTYTVTFSWTGSTGIPISTITMLEFTGSGETDVLVNGGHVQVSPGTGANALTSGSVTTTVANDLCIGWTSDISGSGGTASVGTNIAWTLGAQGVSGTSAANEYFVQVTPGAITADFTTNYAFTSSLTGIVCYEP